MPTLSVILVAAGQSRRFQNPATKKPFVTLNGYPVWFWSASEFHRRPDVAQLILVVSEEDHSEFLRAQAGLIERFKLTVAIGGAERADSVENGLQHVHPDCDFVAIHDAARPCIDRPLLDRIVQQAVISGAAVPAIPVYSTLKRSSTGSEVEATVDRSKLYLAQTPQVFRKDWLLECYHERAGAGVTDDAQLLEQAGYRVSLVEGSPFNLKLTTPQDLVIASAYLTILAGDA